MLFNFFFSFFFLFFIFLFLGFNDEWQSIPLSLYHFLRRLLRQFLVDAVHCSIANNKIYLSFGQTQREKVVVRCTFYLSQTIGRVLDFSPVGVYPRLICLLFCSKFFTFSPLQIEYRHTHKIIHIFNEKCGSKMIKHLSFFKVTTHALCCTQKTLRLTKHIHLWSLHIRPVAGDEGGMGGGEEDHRGKSPYKTFCTT